MTRIAIFVALATACASTHTTEPPAPDAALREDAGAPDVPIEDASSPRADAGAPIDPWDGDGDEWDAGPPLCPEGRQRWCNDAVYDGPGRQTCYQGRWGPCVEPTVTAEGLVDRPATDCGCRYFYFTYECCEDQEDRDGDGNPDCIIPLDHEPPECPTDGTLCSYCDSHADCGGDADNCLFRRDGYSLCGRDCSAEPCPVGYICQEIGTSSGTAQQCVPESGTCEEASDGR